MKRLKLPCKKTAVILFSVFFFVYAADRFTKWLVLVNLELGERAEVIPGILRFTYQQNTGGAFSAFSQIGWLFVIAVPAAVVALILCMFFGVISHPLGIVSCVCILGGAIGNYTDRLMYGYVIDMIDVYCIHFAVFNVADCFITVGCILLGISLFLPQKKDETKETCGN